MNSICKMHEGSTNEKYVTPEFVIMPCTQEYLKSVY